MPGTFAHAAHAKVDAHLLGLVPPEMSVNFYFWLVPKQLKWIRTVRIKMRNAQTTFDLVWTSFSIVWTSFGTVQIVQLDPVPYPCQSSRSDTKLLCGASNSRFNKNVCDRVTHLGRHAWNGTCSNVWDVWNISEPSGLLSVIKEDAAECMVCSVVYEVTCVSYQFQRVSYHCLHFIPI